MSLPQKTENSVRYGRLAARGILTRMALYFSVHEQETFTGKQIVEILLAACRKIGSPESEATDDRRLAADKQVSI